MVKDQTLKNKDTLIADLDYATQLARAGENAPLVGGPIGLMWGILLVPTLFIHGLIIMQILPIQQQWVGLIWMTFGILGGLLTFLIDRKIQQKSGLNSTGNKLEQIIWTATTLVMFCFAVSIAIAVLVLGKPYWLFDVVLALAFGTYVINYVSLGKMTQRKYYYLASAIACGLMIFCLIFISNPVIYLVSAVGVIFTVILPSLKSMKEEAQNA